MVRHKIKHKRGHDTTRRDTTSHSIVRHGIHPSKGVQACRLSHQLGDGCLILYARLPPASEADRLLDTLPDRASWPDW